MEKTIVGVNFKSKHSEAFGNKTYNYFCEIPVSVGDIVLVPVSSGENSIAKVCQIDVDKNSISENILVILKTITSLAEKTEVQS